MSLGFITHDACQLHDMPDNHPEKPERIQMINDLAKSALFKKDLSWYEAPEASLEQLRRVHSSVYLGYLAQKSPKQGYALMDEDTSLNPHTLQSAKHAAGAGVLAVDLVLQKKHQKIFCNIRPPGHHAAGDQGHGFCFYNNIAIAAKHALSYPSIKRVAIIDFDAHHGDGTESIFLNDDQVLFLSCFEGGIFPCVEKKPAKDTPHTILKPGDATKAIKRFFTNTWTSRLLDFKPDIIFISAGFDAHTNDPLANLKFKASDYHWMTEQIVNVADTLGHGQVISMLEGGYHLPALKSCVTAHMQALLAQEMSLEKKQKPLTFSHTGNQGHPYHTRSKSKQSEQQATANVSKLNL